MNASFKSVLDAELGETPAQQSFTLGKPVYLFEIVSGDAMTANTATLSNAGTSDNSFLRRRLHSLNPPCNEKLKHVAVC